MKKRLLSMLLVACMVLTQLPTAALAAASTSVKVGGVEMVNAEKTTTYLKNGAAALGGSESDHNAKLTWSGDTATLTLKNFVYTGAGGDAESAAIYANGDLNLVLEGGSAVTHSGGGSRSDGVYVMGALTISGSGSLVAIGGTATDASCGIYNGGALTINEGTVIATGGTAIISHGIYSGGALSINTGTVIATGGAVTDAGKSYGVRAEETVNLAGGVTVTRAGIKGSSYGGSNRYAVYGKTVTLTNAQIAGAVGYNSSFGLLTSPGPITVDTNKNTIGTGTTPATGAVIVPNGWSAENIKTEVQTYAADTTISADTAVVTAGDKAITVNGGVALTIGKDKTLVAVSLAEGGTSSAGIDSSSDVAFTVENNGSLVAVGGSCSGNGKESQGMKGEAGLTLSGSGSTLAVGGPVSGSTADAYSMGLYTPGGKTLRITDGKVTAVGGTVVSSTSSLTVVSYGLGAGAGGGTGGTVALSGTGTSILAVGGVATRSGSGAESYGIRGNSIALGVTTGVAMGNTAAMSNEPTFEGGSSITAGAHTGKFAAWGVSLPKSATPTATTTTVARASATAKSVDFTLTNDPAYANGQSWKVYALSTGDTQATGVTAANEGNKLTLSHATAIPDRTYYVAVTEEGKVESDRLKLTVSKAATHSLSYGTQSVNERGVTASADPLPTWSPDENGPELGETVNIDVKLTGTPEATGTQTVGLSGVDVDTQTLSVTAGTEVNETKTFQFTMPDKDVTLNVTNTYSPPYVPSDDYTPPLVTEIKQGGSITGNNLDRLISGKKELTVTGADGAKLVFDTDALKGINDQTSGSIKVEIKDVSSDHQTTHQGKTVFTLTVTSGSKTVSSFGGSVKVSLPYTLKDGEKAEDVTVWYLAEDGTMTEISATYDAETSLATFTVTHFSKYVVGVEVPWVNPFTDVKEGDWHYDAVKYAHQKGLFSGVTDTTFAPDASMTRAMLWAVLARQAGQDTSGGANWYEKAQAWAVEQGVSDGRQPTGEITREQMITMLWRLSGSPVLMDYPGLSTFDDAGDISGYAQKAMAWAHQKGLVEGSGNALMPKANATRAQVASIMMRYCESAAK